MRTLNVPGSLIQPPPGANNPVHQFAQAFTSAVTVLLATVD